MAKDLKITHSRSIRISEKAYYQIKTDAKRENKTLGFIIDEYVVYGKKW